MASTDEIKLLSLRALMTAEIERRGMEWGVTVSFVDGDGDACVERPPHHSEGTAPRTMTIRGAWNGRLPSERARGMAARWADHLHRLHMRDVAITSAGGDPRNPPEWTFLAQRMAQTIMANEGRDPLDLVRIDPPRQLRTGWATRATPVTRDPYEPTLEMEGMTSGMLATFERQQGEWHYQDSRAGNPVLGMAPLHLPETVILGIAGRPLDEIVEDPRLAGSGLHIERVHVQPTGAVVFILESKWMRLAEAPPGVDATWLDPHQAGVAVPTI